MNYFFTNENSADIVLHMAKVIVDNKAYLSEIDGKIGDGDHGVNMAKGFGRAAEQIEAKTTKFSEALVILSDVLMNEIGGSMGPLYGMMFLDMSDCIAENEIITAENFDRMLSAGLDGVYAIGEAKQGDKCLLDSLVPAVEAFHSTVEKGHSFNVALDEMSKAAEIGRDSTFDLIAKIGRASRLGERSRGALDAGATSCALILTSMAKSISTKLSI